MGKEWVLGLVDRYPNVGSVAGVTVVNTGLDLASGFVDMLRLGEGVVEGGWGYGKDALRLLGFISLGAKALNVVRGGAGANTGYATRFRGFNKIALRSQKLEADEWGRWQPGWSKIRINFEKVKNSYRGLPKPFRKFFRTAQLETTAYHEAFHQGVYFKISRHISRWLGVRDVYDSSIVWRFGEELSAEIYGISRMVLRRGFGLK